MSTTRSWSHHSTCVRNGVEEESWKAFKSRVTFGHINIPQRTDLRYPDLRRFVSGDCLPKSAEPIGEAFSTSAILQTWDNNHLRHHDQVLKSCNTSTEKSSLELDHITEVVKSRALCAGTWLLLSAMLCTWMKWRIWRHLERQLKTPSPEQGLDKHAKSPRHRLGN